jgi:cell fate (sporulation/competence/biofilm development) regulator YlbF (YheA/YmcA/DUF963 family)
MNDLIKEIKSIIKDSEEYKAAKAAEEKMINDPTTIKLLTLYQQKQQEYNDALRFEEYGSDVETIRKQLADVKMLVDSNELVAEYNRLYAKVKEILDTATKNILKDIV